MAQLLHMARAYQQRLIYYGQTSEQLVAARQRLLGCFSNLERNSEWCMHVDLDF